MILHRKVANIYIPPVTNIENEAFDEMFKAHVLQKQLFQDLVAGGVDHEEVLEALEVFIQTRNMDSYIQRTEQKLDQLVYDY